MAEYLFNRRWLLSLATLSGFAVEISELRVKFTITNTLKRSANVGKLEIYNLPKSIRGSFEPSDSFFELQAGYDDLFGTIFQGDITVTNSIKDRVDWITRIEARDAGDAVRFSRVSKSFLGGVMLSQVLQELVAAMGVRIGNLLSETEPYNRQFTAGYVVHGNASEELDKLLRSLNIQWSIQKGAIVALPRGKALGNTVIELGPDSGLIGTPEFGTPEAGKKLREITFKSFLRSDLSPGNQVKLVSTTHTGPVKVTSVEHVGDSEGSDWSSSCKGVVIT